MAWIAGRRSRVRVTGQSMQPTLSDGEFVLVDPRSSARADDLVVARHPHQDGLLVVKRVTDVEPGGLRLTSDNPDEGSDSRSWGLVAPGNVVGIVTLVLDRPTTGPVLRR